MRLAPKSRASVKAKRNRLGQDPQADGHDAVIVLAETPNGYHEMRSSAAPEGMGCSTRAVLYGG
jgi:hypothetical protein